MADLVNLLPHMGGKSVYVNGTVYQIDQEGVAEGVSEVDAAKLLQGKAWMVYDPKAAVKREERRQALRDQYKKSRGGIQLLTGDGKMVDPKAINKAQEAKQAAAKEYPSMRSEPHTPEVDAGVPVDEPIPAEVEAATHEEQMGSGQSLEEWPDPETTMKKSFLQDMAHAYGLAFTPATKKQELVEMIHRAMYDET